MEHLYFYYIILFICVAYLLASVIEFMVSKLSTRDDLNVKSDE